MTTAPDGFPTWRHLFEHLKTTGFENDQRVALVYPTDPETIADAQALPGVTPAAREVEIYTDEIKARAFEEVYERLPTVSAISVLTDLIDSHGATNGLKAVREFLNKLPTRTD